GTAGDHMSARPWWFPTAVFVAPIWLALTVVTFAIGLWQRDVDPASVGLAVLCLLAGPALTFVHLARAEDRWRDGSRPADLNRWGSMSAAAEHPWRVVALVAVIPIGVIGAFLLSAVIVFAAPAGLRSWLLFVFSVVWIGGPLSLLVWAIRRGGWSTDQSSPFKPMVWRWPVTTGVLGMATGGAWIGLGLWGVSQGRFFDLGSALVFGLPLFLSSWKRLGTRDHPDRHYGREART
ncbi:MAG: hypothetical protein ACRDHF_07300, partial [Tepidiformaceae bacterium]